MDIVLNQNVTINNAELKNVTKAIQKASANVIGNTFKIASLMAKVESDELYLEDGFEDVFDYAKQCFGLEKTSVYNLVRVGNDFIEAVENGKVTNFHTLLTHGDNDYSISQVFKMLPLGIEKAQELTRDGVINETMSCRAIDKIVKENTEGRTTRGKTKNENVIDNDNSDDVINDDTDQTVLFVDWDDVPELFKAFILDNYDIDDNVTTIQVNKVSF